MDPIRRQQETLIEAESRRYSQNGEDGVLERLAELTGCPRTMIELGAGTGEENNSRALHEKGWEVLALDAAPEGSGWIHEQFLTAENVNDALRSRNAPRSPGILSIDLDGNDFWILRTLSQEFWPSVLVAEYNASLGPSDPLAMPYDPGHVWDQTNFYGASLSALDLLCHEAGMDLVYCETQGVNAFFVRRDLLEQGGLVRVNVAAAYRPPMFGWLDSRGNPRGHLPTSRKFVRFESLEEVARLYEGHRPGSLAGRVERLKRTTLQNLSPIGSRWEKGEFIHQSIAEAESYAHDLEEELRTARTARLDVERYAQSLEAEVEVLRGLRSETEHYARSLEGVVEGLRGASGEVGPPASPPPDTGIRFCTVVARNYMAHARVLARSLRRHHPGSDLHVLVIDGEAGSQGREGNMLLLLPSDLDLPRDVFYAMAVIYSVTELSTALKPWLLKTLLINDRTPVIYLDPDIEVFGSLAEVSALAGEHDIVLTPHTLQPMQRDGLEPSEQFILQAGVFNLGFIALGPGAMSFLEWWSVRLLRDCVVKPEKALFVDQRWIDFVPGYFRHHVLQSPGYNLAYWNADRRPLVRTGEGYLAGGEPLRFVHYSGFVPELPDELSKYVAPPRVRLADYPELARLCRSYANRLVAAGYLQCSRTPYRLGRSAGGVSIDPVVRHVFRKALEAFDHGEAPMPPDPFEPSKHEEFLRWLKESPDSERPLVSRYLGGLYDLRPDLSEAFPDLEGQGAGQYLRWAAAEQVLPREFVEAIPGTELPSFDLDLPTVPAADLRPGVNLAGYLFAESGIGQTARLMVETLRASRIPYAVVPFRRAVNRQQAEFTAWGADVPEFLTNILCINADQIPVFLAAGGSRLIENRRTIALWAWEVEKFPERFHASADRLDEIWVYSRHAQRAMSELSKPVKVFPLPVTVPRPGKSTAWRSLPEGFVFAFCFDYLSLFERKNPLAVVDAFRKAFRHGEGAKLLIKSVNGHLDRLNHELLKQRASAHPDIHIVDRYFDEASLNALVAGCDAYVSLHRAEGYGLTLAEAMALGKPVIGTAYSGNLEFMNAVNSYLVPYELVSIPEGCDPYPAGTPWAEPDVEKAAAIMREVFDDRQVSAARGAAAAEHIRTHHSPEARAAMLLEMLGEDASALAAAGSRGKS